MRPACSLNDGLDRIDLAIIYDNLEANFWQEIDDIFGTPVQLGMTFWRPKPLASMTVMPVMPIRCIFLHHQV